MSSQVLEVEKRDGIATLTLNRPEAMNAITGTMLSELNDAFPGMVDKLITQDYLERELDVLTNDKRMARLPGARLLK